MRQLLKIMSALTLAFGVAQAQATVTPVTPNTWYEFNVDTLSAASGGVEWIDLNGTVAGNAPSQSFMFTIANGFFGSLTVIDRGFAGDTYSVLNGSSLLGNTNAVTQFDLSVAPFEFDPDLALANADFSKAVFTLGAGTYSISGLLQQSVLDGSSPLNSSIGSLQLSVSPIPETSSLAMFMAGIALMGAMTRRRI
jgi:hypothetical protein